MRTVRRCAASERLPCHIGIGLTGCGSIVMSLTTAGMYFASKLTGSCDHTARIIAMPSSMRRPRSLNGTPSAANSGSSQPTPTPRISRPPDKFCSVANSLASGSGSRIGRAMTLVPGRTRPVTEGNQVRARIGSKDEEGGGNAHGRLCDALDPGQVEATVASVNDEFGGVDILVNAVGGSTIIANSGARVDELTFAEWQRLIDFNLSATFLFTHAVVPIMKRQQRGKIVNLASIAGRGLSPTSSGAYAAAKGGIIA